MLINPSLDHISSALELIGNPQNSFASIIVAGTNGKGSTCTFLELLYLNSGLSSKVGKYISPHLIKVNERFSIDGVDISDSDLMNLESDLRSKIDSKNYPLTEFEWQTLIAFEYFKRQEIDIGILEVGMGGRWDAVNVVSDRLATVITNIGMDHMNYLGNTLEQIRAEKEAIIRHGVPHFEGRESASNPNSIEGANFKLAVEVFESINSFKVSEALRKRVWEQFSSRYLGRYMQRDGMILDGAHNEPAMVELNKYLQSIQGQKIFILGFLDKDYQSSISQLFHNLIDLELDIVYCTEVESPRATSAKLIYDWICSNYQLKNLRIMEDPLSALEHAQKIKKSDDIIVVTGSLSLVAKILMK